MIFIPIVFGILIIPILLNVLIKYEHNKKSLIIEIKLYKCITILKIRLFLRRGLYFKINSKKEKKVKLNDFFTFRNKIEPFKDYNVMSFSSKLIININQKYWQYIASIFNHINCFTCDFFKKKKPYLKINNSVILTEEIKTKVTVKISIFINVFTVLLSLIKIGVQKIINEFRQKQNKQYNRNGIKERQPIN